MSRFYGPTSILSGLALVFIVGCGSPETVPRYTPSFEYTPPKESKQGAADVTFAIVGARYPTSIPLFQRFGQSVSRDFLGILTARGYTVKGPFATHDEMTFPDKKGSDLVLIPELQINRNASIKWSQGFGAAVMGAVSLQGEGDIVITGRVDLVVAESLSKEKMWTKSINIPPITIHVVTTKTYSRPLSADELVINEGMVYDDVAKALDAQYKAILEKSYQYLDPEEMRIVKKQAQEIRSKKVY